MKKPFLPFGLLVPAIRFAQSYSIGRKQVAGGAGTITGGTYQVSDHARAAGAILGKPMSTVKEGRGMVLVTLQRSFNT